jgi:hypothetical protein
MFSHRSRSRVTPSDPVARRRFRRDRADAAPARDRRPTVTSAELERLYNYGTLLRVR